ncbi:MAG TPA: ABC transporter permease [Gemmatimonadaceae bacterium]|nr:ABC transporter permease [Gemmatimonadaceae bacterium]
MDTVLRDLRYALRTLVRQPGFSIAVALTLALGIGANTAIFSVVNGVLLRHLPYPNDDQLMTVWTRMANGEHETASMPDYLDWKAQNSSFSQMTAYANSNDNLAAPGADPERVPSARVIADYFTTLGVRPAAGRWFVPDEFVFGSHRVVVLSHALWERRFGANPGIVGQTITLNARPYTVVGVAPESARLPARAQLWAPFAVDPSAPPPSRRGDFLSVVARLKPGISQARAQSDMDAIGRRLAAAYPATNARIGVLVISLHDQLVGQIRPALLVFSGAVALVLLIACANVANLLLARATAREREMAVRAALGAGRRRLVRQMLTESLVLALAGGLLGLALAWWGVQGLKAAAPPTVPRLDEVGLDPVALAFTAMAVVVTGFLFGIAPALRGSGYALQSTLVAGGRAGIGGGSGERLRAVLVVAQVALALVLLVGSGLLVRTFGRLQQVDLGFDSGHVLTAQVVLPGVKYDNDARMLSFFNSLHDRLTATPGVAVAGFTSDVPLAGGYNYLSFDIVGKPTPQPGQSSPDAVSTVATAEYFSAMRIPLLSGRLFTPSDGPNAPRVVVVNKELVQKAFGGRDPIGERITFGNLSDSTSWLTIVGVVGSTRLEGVGLETYAQAFTPLTQTPVPYVYVVARTTGDPLALTGALRREVVALDPSLPVANIQSMDQRAAASVAQFKLNSIIVTLFAGVALLLASIGIYAVISYAVAQRTREIGIRMALGAASADVLRLVVRDGMAPAVVGVALGAVGAFGITRLMRSLLYGVSATDPVVFGLVATALVLVALGACWVPARRAARVDPNVALRNE